MILKDAQDAKHPGRGCSTSWAWWNRRELLRSKDLTWGRVRLPCLCVRQRARTRGRLYLMLSDLQDNIVLRCFTKVSHRFPLRIQGVLWRPRRNAREYKVSGGPGAGRGCRILADSGHCETQRFTKGSHLFPGFRPVLCGGHAGTQGNPWKCKVS